MKSKGIKNLLIDLGGVLVNLDRQRCMDNFKQLGLTEVEKRLDIQQLDGILLQHEKGLVSSAEFREEMRKMIGKPVSDEQMMLHGIVCWLKFLLINWIYCLSYVRNMWFIC